MDSEAAVSNARHSMDSPEWYTPSPIAEAAREVMGGIDLDPASCAEANEIVRANRYYTEAENGLIQPWHGRVFLNPPGGLVPDFWRKAVAEWEAQRLEQMIYIGYSLEQLQTLQNAHTLFTPMHFPMAVPAKRIAFVENEAKRAERIAKLIVKGEAPDVSERARKIAAACRLGKPPKDAPSHANFITYVGPNVGAFEAVFVQFGDVRP